MQIYLLILFKVLVVDGKVGDYNVIDLSDILNADYMPGSLLVLENPEEKKLFKNDTTTTIFDDRGTFDDAFATMGYHRKMMNEYLCRSYISEQIISEMKSTRIRRRLGNPAENNLNVGSLSSRINFSIKNNLLEDEGSSSYREWLKKSATLEDIYRHYDNAQNREAPESGRDSGDEINEDFDESVTGYGYQQQQQANNSPSKLGHSGTGSGYAYHYPSGGMHSGGGGAAPGLYSGNSGYGTGGSYFGGHTMFGEGGGGHSGHGYGGGGHDHTPKFHGGHTDKDKLADLFDIALTALAYLSFGMFIIQVIMCISMTSTTAAPAMTMMPMSMGTTGVDTTGGMMGSSLMGEGIGNEGNSNGAGTTGGATSTGGGTTGGGTTGGDGGDGGTPTDGGDGEIEEGANGGSATTGGGDGATGGATTGPGDGGDNGTRDVGGGDTEGGTTGRGDVGTGGFTTGREESDYGGNDGDGTNNDWGTEGGTTGGDGERTTASGSIGTGGTGETAASDTGETAATGDGRDEMNFRNRRDIPVIAQPNNEALNELARRILISIEAALVAHQDDGNCLRKALCENNMYSRGLESNQKYWIPVWSLGMSWLSGRLINNVPRTTSMLDSLKASLLGLGKADCEIVYRNCDLGKERSKRRRRRRKRSIH